MLNYSIRALIQYKCTVKIVDELERILYFTIHCSLFMREFFIILQQASEDEACTNRFMNVLIARAVKGVVKSSKEEPTTWQHSSA